MTTDARIEQLERRRQDLKAKVAEENNRPYPDDVSLMRLKKEKCRIKDEIAALRERSAAAAAA